MSNREMPASGAPVDLILVNLTTMGADLLRFALTGQEMIRLVGCAETATDLEGLLQQHTPHVALVSSSGSASAVSFLELIAASAPAVRPIVMSNNMNRDEVVSFFRSGARGLVCKSQTDLPLLLKCIQCVGIGQVWATSEQLDQLLCSLSQPRSLRVSNVLGDSLLSQREEQVLHLLADGLSNRELAKTLKLSEHTVKNHLFRIFDKLGVSNRMEAVLYAISRREQEPPAPRRSSTAATQVGAA